jgi:hypothetical protein
MKTLSRLLALVALISTLALPALRPAQAIPHPEQNPCAYCLYKCSNSAYPPPEGCSAYCESVNCEWAGVS